MKPRESDPQFRAGYDAGWKAGYQAAGHGGYGQPPATVCGCCRQPINDHKPVQPVWEYRP